MKKQTKIPPGYKASPLGPIPNDWDLIEFVDVVDKNVKWSFTGGPFGSNLKAEDYTNTGVRIIQLQNIGDGEFFDDYKIYTSHKKADELLSCNIYPKEIIISKMGDPVARACFIPETEKRFLMASDGIRFVPDKMKYNSFFVLNLINDITFRKQAIQASTGSTRQRIGLDDLKGLSFPKPSLKEQTAIANLLNTWDKAIQTTSTLIEQKQKRKKWLMQMLLKGKKRLKGFEKTKWKEVRLGDIFERVTTKNTEGNQTVVTISAQRGFVMQNDYFNKIIASELLDNYFLVEKGEFCYNKSYSNGYPMGATKRLNDFEKAVVTTLYICFRIKNHSKSSGDFFEHLFDANALDKGLMSVANEGGRAHGLLNVTPTDFFNIKINIPEFNEQNAISKVLLVSNKEIKTLQNKLDKLKEQKKGLMQILLTGKKRLKI